MDDFDEFDAPGWFRRLSGAIERGGTIKRNGKRYLNVGPSASGEDTPAETPLWEKEKMYVNLNEIERRTWERILRGWTITEIAKAEGVTRQAILSRIGGNSKNQGGMIGKNFHVLVWWLCRSKGRSEGPDRDS